MVLYTKVWVGRSEAHLCSLWKGPPVFDLNDKVVYPGHGVAKINRIVSKRVAGSTLQFFELVFLTKDMTILIPTGNLASVGIRQLSSASSINSLFRILAEPLHSIGGDINGSNWNKRNKEYQYKIRSGDLQSICKIYRDLKCIATHKELSFGEKHLLQETESLLAQEISIVKCVERETAVQQLRSYFLNTAHQSVASSF